MKKQICTLVTLLAASSGIMAQNWLTAGNTLIGGEKLGGSSGNFPLDFYINNTNHLSLTTNGDLNLKTAGKAFQINGNNVLWHNSTITSNIFVGVAAGANNGATGIQNTFVGYGAGNANTANSNYTFVGYKAGFTANGGSTNTYMGSMSGMNDGTGIENTYLGLSTGANCSGCQNNTYIGHQAGKGPSGTTNVGDYNTAVGYNSLTAITSGSLNVNLGASSGVNITSGNRNVNIGYSAGSTITTGSNNLFLGNTADASTNSLSYAHAIGSGASVTTNSTMILGNNDINVGIGYSGASLVTNAKFNIKTTGLTISNANSYGAHGINSNTHNGTSFPLAYAFGFGVYGESTGSSNAWGYNYGGQFKATTGQNCVGVGGISQAPGGSSALLSYGGYFNASYTSTSTTGNAYGLVAYASSGAANYGVYASVSNVNGNYGVFSVGDIYVNGVNSGTGYLTVSDQAFKTNVSNINQPLTSIRQLQPKSYYYDTANTKGFNFPKEKQFGFLAQEVQQVLPHLVKTVKRPAIIDADGKKVRNDTTHLTINYDGFIALLVGAVQKLDSANQALQNQINTCCASGSRTNGSGNVTPGTNETQSAGSNKPIDVELSDANVIVLNQNVPNPFAEQTTITFNIPENSGFAQILFYDYSGRLIKAVDVPKKGKGSLNVVANDLSNGTYSYNLVIDGKIYDTKKMLKQQ